jgi:hypothetical protein
MTQETEYDFGFTIGIKESNDANIKKTTNREELILFLEELYKSDEASEEMELIYEKYMYGEYVTPKEWKSVYIEMQGYYDDAY